MPNWCDVVLFWELVNVDKTKTASSPRIGFTSLIDVNLTRGILASSVNQTGFYFIFSDVCFFLTK